MYRRAGAIILRQFAFKETTDKSRNTVTDINIEDML